MAVNSSALQAVEWCNPSTSCYGFCRSIAIIASGDGRQRSKVKGQGLAPVKNFAFGTGGQVSSRVLQVWLPYAVLSRYPWPRAPVQGRIQVRSWTFLVHGTIDILKSTVTLIFTVLTPSRDKRRYRVTEKRYRAQNNGPTFVMVILQKMQKHALFLNWRDIRSTYRSR